MILGKNCQIIASKIDLHKQRTLYSTEDRITILLTHLMHYSNSIPKGWDVSSFEAKSIIILKG